jgi:O-antigen/teichoic acid export membrane protein
MLGKSLYLFLSQALGFGIRIILPVFLVRIITKAEYGAYSQFFLLEVLIQTIFQMGVIQSLFYFVPRDEKNAGGYLLNSLTLNIGIFSVGYTLVWFFRSWVATETGMGIILDFFWYLSSYSLLMILNVCIVSYLSARQEILSASIITILREIIASIATLIAAFTFRTLESIFLALVLARALTFLVGVAYIHFKLNGFASERYFFGIREQVRYGLVLGIGGTIGTIGMRFHELIASRYYPEDVFAVYAAGLKQIPILQFLSQALAAVALAQFAKLVKDDDWEGVRKLWDSVLGTMYGLGIPLIVVFLLISKPLVLLMFTDAYAGAVSIFRINTLATFALVLNATLVLRAIDRNDVTLKINLGMLIILPFSLYGGMKLGGLDGIICVHMLILLASKVAAHAYLNRLSPVPLPYIASRQSLIEFYRSSWYKGLDMANKVLRRGT